MYIIVNIDTGEKSLRTFNTEQEAEEYMLLNSMDYLSENPEYEVKEVKC